MSIAPLIGRPGISSARTAQWRNVFKSADFVRYYEGGGTLDGAKCRDGDNTDNTLLLRPGVMMGKVASSKKWAPSVIGVMKTSALTGAGTEITINAAQAVELVRRVGATGTFKLTGPPVAAGTVRTLTATYSAVDTTTGAVTITALGVADVWTLTAPAGQDGGMYQLEVTTGKGTSAENTQVTAALAANANTATVDAALEALSNVGAGGVAAVYADPTLTLTFISNLGPVHVRVLADTTNDGGVFEGGWSAVHTTTGVDGRFIIGSFVQPTDGSNAPLTVIPDGFGILMAVDSSDVEWPQIPTQGSIVGSQLLPAWPSDTSLQAWIKAALCPANGGPRFSFDDVFSGV